MKKIYPGDDFSVKLPDYIAGKELPDGSSVSVKIFTINQTESYSFSITENPLPKTVELSSDVLIYMTSGVVQGMMTVNIPDTDMDDSFYNYTRILTTDLFWVNKNSAGQSLEELNNKINALDTSVKSNYYNRTETDNLLDSLWSDISGTYVDDTELFTVVDALDSSVKSNYYTKGTIEYNFATKTYVSQGLLQCNYNLDSRFTSLDSSVRNNYYDKAEVDTKIGNIDLSDYYTKSQTYSRSEIDTKDAQLQNYVNNNFPTLIQLQNNYYDKTQVDELIEQGGSSIDTSGLVDSSMWDNTNKAVAVELLNQHIKDIELESSFNNYYTKTVADSRYARTSDILDLRKKYLSITDAENRMRAIAVALAAIDASLQS